MFTIFTPTRNRAHLLLRLYSSLESQEYKNFEWLIIDDESTDNTESVVSSIIKDSSIRIRYIKQKYGHKKKAFNNAVKNASGEFFVCVDSDDELLPNALVDILTAWNSIPDEIKQNFSGVNALGRSVGFHPAGKIFPSEIFDAYYYDVVYKLGLTGDYLNMYLTKVLRSFPFPEDFSGLCPEGIVWSRIGLKYKTRHINKVVANFHESDDSISKGNSTGSILGGYIANSAGGFLLNAEKINIHLDYMPLNVYNLVKLFSDHTRLWIHANFNNSKKFNYLLSINSNKNKIKILLCLPIGLIYFIKDAIKIKFLIK